MWLYLSIVDDEGFLGGMYIPQAADNVFEDPIWEAKLPVGLRVGLRAIKIAVRLMPDSLVPQDHKWHDRFLTEAELNEATNGQISRYGDLRKAAEGKVN